MLTRSALLPLVLTLCLLAVSHIAEGQAISASAPPAPRNSEKFSAFSALWRTDENFRTTIHISNQLATTEIDAVLTIYMADGTAFDLPAVHLAKSGVVSVDLNAALANAPQGIQAHLSSYGSARLQYQYAWQGAVLASIAIVDAVRSLEYMAPFVFPPNQGAGENLPAQARQLRDWSNGTLYEGLWFREGHNGGGFLALADTTDQPISVHVAMSGLRNNPIRDVPLQGHAAALINLSDLFGVDDTRVGGVTISHSGPSGALQIVGGLEDLTTGFSTNMPIVPVPARTRRVADRQYGSAGMMVNAQDAHLDFPAGVSFSPYAFFRNIASASLTLHLSAWYQEGNTAKHVTLPDLVLQPGQAGELDIHDLLKNDPQVSDVNLLYEYTGEYGDIVAATGSTDGTGNYVFPVIPEPVAPSGSKSSGYWESVGGFDTMYSIWNPTGSPQDLIATIRYGAAGAAQGQFVLPINLEEYASTMIDMAELIRTQQPDQDGNVIPPDTQRGMLELSPPTGRPEDRMTVVVSSGIYNPQKATCGYNCLDCSGYTTDQIDPSPFSLGVSNSVQGSFTYWMANGTPYDITSGASWSSSNTSIASVQTTGQSSPGQGTGVSPGSTYFSAQYSPVFVNLGQFCETGLVSCPTMNIGASAPVPVAPTIAGISPAQGLVGTQISVTISGTGFAAGATVNAGSNISVSGLVVKSDTQITANFTPSNSTSAGGNQGVTVTVSEQPSNSQNFFVQYPLHLVYTDELITPNNGHSAITSGTNINILNSAGQTVPNGAGVCGAYQFLTYTPTDQSGNQINNGTITFTESFSNFPSPDPFGASSEPTPGPPANVSLPGGYLGDEQALWDTAPPACKPASKNDSFNQQFTASVGSVNYSLSTVIAIARSTNSQGVPSFNVSITTP
ncbi:MAG: hypothetical protein ACLQHF_14990 [Terracidiphilus sp.]